MDAHHRSLLRLYLDGEDRTGVDSVGAHRNGYLGDFVGFQLIITVVGSQPCEAVICYGAGQVIGVLIGDDGLPWSQVHSLATGGVGDLKHQGIHGVVGVDCVDPDRVCGCCGESDHRRVCVVVDGVVGPIGLGDAVKVDGFRAYDDRAVVQVEDGYGAIAGPYGFDPVGVVCGVTATPAPGAAVKVIAPVSKLMV